MKFTIMAALLLVSTAAFAAPKTVLLKTRSYPGLFGGPNPKSLEVTVMSDGKVIKSVWQQNATTSEKIAVLSPASVRNIIAKIDAIEKDTPLVDPNEGGPQCLDAGGKTVTMTKDGEEKEIKTWAGCHTSELQYGVAYDLISIIEGFESLAH